jgi:hypothetical protein
MEATTLGYFNGWAVASCAEQQRPADRARAARMTPSVDRTHRGHCSPAATMTRDRQSDSRPHEALGVAAAISRAQHMDSAVGHQDTVTCKQSRADGPFRTNADGRLGTCPVSAFLNEQRTTACIVLSVIFAVAVSEARAEEGDAVYGNEETGEIYLFAEESMHVVFADGFGPRPTHNSLPLILIDKLEYFAEGSSWFAHQSNGKIFILHGDTVDVDVPKIKPRSFLLSKDDAPNVMGAIQAELKRRGVKNVSTRPPGLVPGIQKTLQLARKFVMEGATGRPPPRASSVRRAMPARPLVARELTVDAKNRDVRFSVKRSPSGPTPTRAAPARRAATAPRPRRGR